MEEELVTMSKRCKKCNKMILKQVKEGGTVEVILNCVVCELSDIISESIKNHADKYCGGDIGKAQNTYRDALMRDNLHLTLFPNLKKGPSSIEIPSTPVEPHHEPLSIFDKMKRDMMMAEKERKAKETENKVRTSQSSFNLSGSSKTTNNNNSESNMRYLEEDEASKLGITPNEYRDRKLRAKAAKNGFTNVEEYVKAMRAIREDYIEQKLQEDNYFNDIDLNEEIDKAAF